MRLLLLLLLISCGKDDPPPAASAPACQNVQFLGRWTEQGGTDVLTFNADCSATGSECGYKMTFTPINSNDETTLKVISNNGDPLCLDPDTYTCEVDVAGNLLGFDCGFGVFIYEK